MSSSDRYVVKHGTDWAVKKGGVPAPEAVFDTQREAERVAKETAADLGGGEVRIQDRHGRWRDSDTVPLGNDPSPPCDKKH